MYNTNRNLKTKYIGGTVSVKINFIEQVWSGLCGPASLRIVLAHLGKNYSEEELARFASATVEVGTEHEGLIQAIKKIGGFVFAKGEGTIEELEYFTNKENVPVIIGWFDKGGDHYSVVTSVTKKNIIIMDPAADTSKRLVKRESFSDIWFDFIGKDTILRGWYMIITTEKKYFPEIEGGFYF